MTALDKTMAENKRHFSELNIKPMFSHCIMCSGATGCYTDNSFGFPGHPNFLDPDCYKKPMLPEEK